MHNDVTRPERQYGSCSHATWSPVVLAVEEIVLDQFYLTYLKAQTNRPSRYSTAQPDENTCQYYFPLNFPLRGNTKPLSIRS